VRRATRGRSIAGSTIDSATASMMRNSTFSCSVTANASTGAERDVALSGRQGAHVGERLGRVSRRYATVRHFPNIRALQARLSSSIRPLRRAPPRADAQNGLQFRPLRVRARHRSARARRSRRVTAVSPAMRPVTRASVMAFPERRFAPCMPPIASPQGEQSIDPVCIATSTAMPPSMKCAIGRHFDHVAREIDALACQDIDHRTEARF